MVIDHAVNDGEAEPGAFAAFLGGVERLENVRLYLLADPGAGIDDADEDVALGIGPAERFAQLFPGSDAGRERDRAVVRHGVARVDAEVEQHLVDLAPVGLGQRQARLQLEQEIDRLGESGGQHALHLLGEDVQIERREPRFRLARGSEELLDEGSAARDRVADDLDRLAASARDAFSTLPAGRCSRG